MKVFSLEKFKADMGDVSTIDVQGAIDGGKGWACQSEGKTKEEMNSMGLGTCDEWMIELPDSVPQSPASESATSLPTPSCLDPLYGGNRVGEERMKLGQALEKYESQYTEVGDTILVQGIPCRIKARKRCKGCILTGAPMDICYKYACTPFERMDSKNVSFVRIKRL